MSVRAVRGATQLSRDDAQEMNEAVVELMQTLLQSNGFTPEDLISVIFTVTQDLISDFPAASARAIGLGEVPLLCALEIPVPGSLPRTIRVLAHAETAKKKSEIVHPYLRGTSILRKDLAQ